MRTSILALFFLLAVSGLFTSCDPEGCTDRDAINFDIYAMNDDGSCLYEEKNVAIVFKHLAGTQPLELEAEYTTSGGTRFKFSDVQWYMCDFHFTGDTVEDRLSDTYILVGSEHDTVPLARVKSGIYSGFGLMVGVDSAANHIDPATWPSSHALSSNQQRFSHWGWDTGFIFVSITGYLDSTASGNGQLNVPFNFHIGIDKQQRTLNWSHSFSVTGHTVTYLPLHIDYLRLFDDIDLRTQHSTHSMGAQLPLAQQFANGFQAAFIMP
jgi:hypothetical protein